MRRRWVPWIAAGAALAALLPGSASAVGFSVIEAGGARFPDRSYVLSLPAPMRLSAGMIHVRENGQSIAGLSVLPVEQAAKKFGVVLVIDASKSMRGEPQRSALAAARLFAARRKPNQQLGIVTFNQTATVVLEPTTDRDAIAGALASPQPLRSGTHIFDAVDRAIVLLRDKKVQAGSVVVLSDGADTGSRTTEDSVAAAARLSHVRVFTVGLRSRFFSKEALAALAADSRARFTEAASTGQLGSIYRLLGAQLASEYLIRYRSLAGPGRAVQVRVSLDRLAGVAGTRYETPKLHVPAKAEKGAGQKSLLHRLWTSTAMMVLIVMLAAFLLGIGIALALANPDRSTLRRRMAEFVNIPLGGKRRQRPTSQLTGRVLEGTGSFLQGRSWWERFKWELAIAEVSMPAEQIVVLTTIGTVVTLWLVKLITGSLLVAVVLGGAVPFVVRWAIRRKLERRRALFAEQLPDNLQVLASAMRAGHSFVAALSVVVDDSPEPSKGEFQRVIADEQLGFPLDQALDVVVKRMANRELEQVALVATLQRETGGNTAEVLDRVTETIRERFALRRTVQTLTAQGRLSRWVLSLLPLMLLVVITLINPGYIGVMYESGVGRILLVMSGISVTAGSLVIKRIVNIKV